MDTIENVSNPEPAITSVEWACRSKSERLYPECEWKESFLFSEALSSKHPFLQKLIDYKGVLTNWMGEWTYLALQSQVMIHVYENFVNIECISTPVEYRNQGSATKVMTALVEAAKETGTELRLRACNVTGSNWLGPNHMVIAHGMKTKGKIPTARLPKWYEKFGFEKVSDVIYRGKKKGVNMRFIPK